MTYRFMILFSILLSSPLALANAPADCPYRGEEQLHCDGNIVVAPGTQIVTHERSVTLITSKSIIFGNAENGVKITCAEAGEASTDATASCGQIYIFASETLFGSLDATARAEGRLPAAIQLFIGSYAKDFKMHLDTEEGLLYVERRGQERTTDDKSLRWAAR